MSSGNSNDVTDEEYFWKLWKDADARGNLVDRKHDPGDVGTLRKGFRTVVAKGVLPQLKRFPITRQVHISVYEQLDRPPDEFRYCWVVDTSHAGFSVAASGIPSLGAQPTDTCDRLIAVSGAVKDFHIYGEDSQRINQRILDGKLKLRAEFPPKSMREQHQTNAANQSKRPGNKGSRPNLNKVRVSKKTGR
jgi:hypothetical protein